MCSLITASLFIFSVFFFFNDTATTEIYTLSLHDALPISGAAAQIPRESFPDLLFDRQRGPLDQLPRRRSKRRSGKLDRKSTRLNSSHLVISYAVFCLKKKKKKTIYLVLHIMIA